MFTPPEANFYPEVVKVLLKIFNGLRTVKTIGRMKNILSLERQRGTKACFCCVKAVIGVRGPLAGRGTLFPKGRRLVQWVCVRSVHS